MRYNPQGLEVCGKLVKCSESKFGTIAGKRKSNKAEVVHDFTNYPRMVLSFRKDTCKDNLHPTQKPVALCEYLIKTYTDEGMTVLDNCMGSGSTGVACINTNRNFIGIELDDKYFQIADNRLREAMELNNESNSTVV
jgi:site-specific DNA-methyltransferase (adenine-specific)